MRFVRLLAATLLLLPAIAAAQSEPVKPTAPAATATERPAAKPPLATSRRSFFIPVTVERAARDHVPVEVHLLVSADQGKTWSTYARQAADSKGFQFQARDDGEYWFASRTLDAQGRAKPSGETEAELRIVIDATQPKVELDAAVTSTGDIKAAWRISDATALPEGVRLEYQQAESAKSAWQSVTLDPALQKQGGGMLLGSATWSPSSSSRVIDVRVVVQDRSRNVGTDVRRVILPRRSDVPISKLPEFPAKTTPKVAAANPASGDPFTARQFGAGGAFNSSTASKPAKVDASSSGGTPWPVDNKLPAPPSMDKVADKAATLPTEPLARLPSEVAPPVSERVVAKPASTGDTNPLIWSGNTPRETGPLDKSSGLLSGDATPSAPLASVPSLPPTIDTASSIEPGSGMDKPQLSPSKSFSLDYDVDSVGPSGMRAAELWVTVDGCKTWEKWGEDEDKRSPFEIQVQSERTFGFRMVIVANNGLATHSPAPGDPADIWVAVDSTKPRAKLIQAAYGQGEHAGQLDIRWEADDEHLGSRPVSIAFSETADGPYTTLAAGLPNNGQHYWTIDPHTPRKLYLRLEVRDDAGNIGSDQTAEPVSLEGLSPKGRIRGVIRPGPALQGAFRTPLFR
jgi:hypothetical protein